MCKYACMYSMHVFTFVTNYFASLCLQSIVIILLVHLFVCLSCCLPACLCGQTSPNFLCMLPVTVADGVTMCYILPVVLLKSCFHTMRPMGKWAGTALDVLARQLPLAEHRPM